MRAGSSLAKSFDMGDRPCSSVATIGNEHAHTHESVIDRLVELGETHRLAEHESRMSADMASTIRPMATRRNFCLA